MKSLYGADNIVGKAAENLRLVFVLFIRSFAQLYKLLEVVFAYIEGVAESFPRRSSNTEYSSKPFVWIRFGLYYSFNCFSKSLIICHLASSDPGWRVLVYDFFEKTIGVWEFVDLVKKECGMFFVWRIRASIRVLIVHESKRYASVIGLGNKHQSPGEKADSGFVAWLKAKRVVDDNARLRTNKGVES